MSRLTTTGSWPLRTRTQWSWFVPARVDLLMRHERRHVDEIARPRFRRVLERVAPPHARAAADDEDHALELAVMMRAGLRVRVNRDRAGPQLARARARVRDRRGARHARRLRRVQIERRPRHDLHAVVAPVAGRQRLGHRAILSPYFLITVGSSPFFTCGHAVRHPLRRRRALQVVIEELLHPQLEVLLILALREVMRLVRIRQQNHLLAETTRGGVELEPLAPGRPPCPRCRAGS